MLLESCWYPSLLPIKESAWQRVCGNALPLKTKLQAIIFIENLVKRKTRVIEKDPKENLNYKRHEHKVKKLKYLFLFLSIPSPQKLFCRAVFPEKQTFSSLLGTR